ncbi:MAG: AarF/UbiB family protein [Actinobacteria bacterium]|nr:AarF/UbiB family protein [Actinomycetota bacterium]
MSGDPAATFSASQSDSRDDHWVGDSSNVPRIRPRRLPSPTKVEKLHRGTQMGISSAKRFGPLFFHQIRKARHGVVPAEMVARPLRQVFEDLGGTFIKFGQIIASSPGMFGDEVSEEFRSCLDTGPPVPFADVRERIEDDLGMSLDEAFLEFDREPIGQASIAVVYKARTHDGRQVAVKVLRPGIEQLVAMDLDLMQPLVEMFVRQTGDQFAGSILQLLDGFRVQIGEEMDLRNEARSLSCFRQLSAEVSLPLLVVPMPYPELSGPNVLTMEYLDGVPIDDLAEVERMGIDPLPLVEQVVRGFFLTAVRWGAFHGDMHAGNMLLLRDGRIGVIDWGIVGRLDRQTHWFFLRLLSAILGEEEAWGDVSRHITETYGPAIQEAVGLSDDDLTAFIRSLVEPAFNLPFGEVSLATIMQTTQLQVARAQGIQARKRSPGALLHRLRAQRRLRKMVDEAGGIMSDFDRGTFLLGKQLMYFERYGKMFLADVPILNDREFFEQLMEGRDARDH